MDYSRQIKSFLNSHYLSEGIRITTGVLIPAFAMSYFHLLPLGIIISLGALLVSITDSPGPIHHRKNGMAVTVVCLLLVTICAGFSMSSHLLMVLLIAAFCFFFSMIAIYGARAASIGIATLVMFTISLDPQHNLTSSQAVFQYSFLITCGGIWYLVLSLLLYNVTPYRLPRQALGDCIQSTAEYLLLRAELYKKEVDYENVFKKILLQQAVVQQKQNEISELLLKTRSIVKESTNIGRTLVLMHFDVSDIFEKIMMSHHKYAQLHSIFDDTGILTDFYRLATKLSHELNNIGIAIKSGDVTTINESLLQEISLTYDKLEELRQTFLNPGNIEGFIALRKVFDNIQDLSERVTLLHRYTAYDKELTKKAPKKEAFEKMVSSQQVDPGLFINNLNFRSDTFRHSVRLSIAVVAGYLIGLFFPVGHSYWILLTIIVILKPAYSLTKKRNSDRLIGTIAGVIIGIGLVYLIKDERLMLFLIIVFMIGSYTSMRRNYFISVLLMTPFLVMFYHLLNPKDFTVLLKDRVIDTTIGSAIAFAASFFLFPSWERDKVKPVAITLLKDVNNYFGLIATLLEGNEVSRISRQLARRNAFVALANLSDAFNRMLSEPEHQQKGVNVLHQFVVLNHTFTSYVATLIQYVRIRKDNSHSTDFLEVSKEIRQLLEEAIEHLTGKKPVEQLLRNKEPLRRINSEAEAILKQRKEELRHGFVETPTKDALLSIKAMVDQFNLVYNVASDINKVAKELRIQ